MEKLTKKEIEYITHNIKIDLDCYCVNIEDLPKEYEDIQHLKKIPKIVWKKAKLDQLNFSKNLLENLYKKVKL